LVEGFYLKQLDEPKRKLFGALVKASSYWAIGELGSNTLTSGDIESMKMFQRELADYAASHPLIVGVILRPSKKKCALI